MLLSSFYHNFLRVYQLANPNDCSPPLGVLADLRVRQKKRGPLRAELLAPKLPAQGHRVEPAEEEPLAQAHPTPALHADGLQLGSIAEAPATTAEAAAADAAAAADETRGGEPAAKKARGKKDADAAKQRKPRKQKHPDAPKRGKTACALGPVSRAPRVPPVHFFSPSRSFADLWFMERHRAEQAALHRAPGDPSKPRSMGELTQILAKMWKEAGAEEKAACEELAAESKAAYATAREQFLATHPEEARIRKRICRAPLAARRSPGVGIPPSQAPRKKEKAAHVDEGE